MDMIDRRALLDVKENPDRKLDYVITFSGELESSPQTHRIVLRYIPDRQVLDAHGFARYIEAIDKMSWDTPEDLAVTVLSDVNNEIVARWVQVSLSAPEQQNSSITTHGVVIEDHQPGWENRSLLGRLERI